MKKAVKNEEEKVCSREEFCSENSNFKSDVQALFRQVTRAASNMTRDYRVLRNSSATAHAMMKVHQ